MAFLAFLAAGVSCNKEAPGPAGNETPDQAGHGWDTEEVCTATFHLNLDGMRTKAVTAGSPVS